MKRSNGYIVLLLSLIVTAIGVTLAVNSLLISTQISDTTLSTEEARRADAAARSCADVAIDNLIENKYYGGDETITVDTDVPCRILSISGQGNGPRVIQTQATINSVTRYIETRLSQVAPSVVLDYQKNIQDIASGEASATALNQDNPYLVDPDALQLWLKADTINVNDGAPITLWNDSSDNDNFANQTGADALKPTFNQTGLNNLPTVSFDGTDDFFQSSTTPFHSNTDGLTVIVLAKANNTSTDNTFLGKFDTANSEREWRIQNDNATLAELGSSHSGNEEVTYTAAQDDFRVIVMYWFPGSAMEVYVDRAYVNNAVTPVATITETSEPLIVGAQLQGTSGFLNGEIAEVMIYNKQLNEVEQEQVEDYLYTKYAL